MSYLVLARKWRPKSFAEMVGQGHVLQALTNALDKSRLHHAYLFTGTRGVGKTTVARIFAKALNCEQGISSTPCGVCNACVEIDQGRFVDLIEVDAASRTGVDDTRELLDNIAYAPVRGRFKIYLIDEVHMFSKSSFNALLKTLEEPPEHVKFLLATTDPQKLPVTVLSRCLQFNLRALPVTQIQAHLADVLLREQIKAEPAGLNLIAEAANGSMRDALSLLDQAIAFTDGKLEPSQISQILGLSDHHLIWAMIEALAEERAEQLFQCVEDALDRAVEPVILLTQLIESIHQLSLQQWIA
ncbi:MAG: DNA polymerase III, subunit gamma and tau, partial [Halothiobacillus sp. 35-54-62]